MVKSRVVPLREDLVLLLEEHKQQMTALSVDFFCAFGLLCGTFALASSLLRRCKWCLVSCIDYLFVMIIIPVESNKAASLPLDP